MTTFAWDRRAFLKGAGAGLLVVLAESAGVAQQESGRGFRGHEMPKDIGSWLHIGSDGRVTAFTGKVEVGQNIRTSLAQQVAEELRVPFDCVEMVMGDTDLVPWDMGTFGSRTTPDMGPRLRTMAAAARQMLLEQAAQAWNVDASSLRAANGKILNGDGSRSISYGELTQGEKLVKVVTAEQSLTPASEWKVAGTSAPKPEGRAFVTGAHKYPSDIVRPGMMFGAIVRPEGFHAKLISVDSKAAESLPGVTVVRDGDFIGVVAPDAFTAHRAAAMVNAAWDVPEQPSNENLFEYLKNNPETSEPRHPDHQSGSMEDGMRNAEIKVEERYTVQYIAHAPLEPRAAVAEWNNGKLTVWTGTQRPFGVREELAQHFSIPESQVRVIQPDMGSGYGGKHSGEAAVEAARLAKAANKPVKLLWTRREEFTWAYLRPAALIEIHAGVRRDGTLVAWEHHNYNAGNATINTPYDVSNQLIQYHPTKTPLRQGSYRALAGTANNFARESHMDALAHAAGMDPLQFRMKNLSNARLKAVLQSAADKFGWDRAKSNATCGYGLACGSDKGGYVATCAEVEIDSDKTIRVRRVVQAWESGAVINPNGLNNQNSGGVVQALGGALFEAILFSQGKILNPQFARYRLPRFSDTPKIEIVLVDRKDLPPAGAGEIGLIGVAPAIANAIFAATGVRVRNMPIAPEEAIPGIPASPFRS
ncbi:isoquinoline 1-oxidoreductase [Acidobacteria bacterium AB60]|nr:isoquinoline 1-oxidoreductase [Acidobacteria bacterium AB60]